MLSQLAGEVVEPSATYAPPQTATEQTIARIWQEVLGLEKVGVHDNFFDLGGHSLLLGRVHDALRSALDQEVLIVDLFTYPTISLLIEHLNQKQDGEEEAFQQTYDRAESRLASAQRQRRVRQSSALLQERQGDQDE
jgi:acyl carrier protein